MATLTPRQEAFAREYSVDHNGRQAAIRAGYSPNGAEVTASQLLTKPKVQEALATHEHKHTTALTLTAELVLTGLLDIALNGEREANRVRSWELLGKHLALFTDRVDITVTDAMLDAEIERLTSQLAEND